MPQVPGTFYIGNLCAPWHQVVHATGETVEPLYREEPRGEGIHIAVMLRSDVFRCARARAKGGEPSPVDVYRAINACVAANIGRGGLRLPSLAECIEAFGQPVSARLSDHRADHGETVG